MNLNVLYEDSHIVVCEKPVGIPSQSDKTSDYDMINRLKNYICEKQPNIGQPYIGIVHRLDRPVGGVMVFAKSPFAAKELSEQIRLKRVKKKYFGVVTSDLSDKLDKDKVLLTDFLVKNQKTNLASISTGKDKNAKKAELYYKVVSILETPEGRKMSLLEIELLTGRHHQIRIQLSNIGSPLWGDTKYNREFINEETRKIWTKDTEKANWSNIALFAYQITFTHPKTGKEMVFQLKPYNYPFECFDL